MLSTRALGGGGGGGGFLHTCPGSDEVFTRRALCKDDRKDLFLYFCVPDVLAHVGGEEAEDEGIGRRVEGGEALHKRRHNVRRLIVRDQVEHLQWYVRTHFKACLAHAAQHMVENVAEHVADHVTEHVVEHIAEHGRVCFRTCSRTCGRICGRKCGRTFGRTCGRTCCRTCG
jgi:hypothetical protein